jgi:NAD(P)-dependent dehydrogenase (short-subunit alcohol dehydrogenase family)
MHLELSDRSNTMSSRLAGRVAIVTGAARGLGLGIATRFSAEGAVVVIADRDVQGAQSAARELGADHLECDVTKVESVQHLIDETCARHGRLDVIVANAGITGGGPFLELSDERWQAVLDVNLRGVFLTNQLAGRRFAAQGTGGAIVNITSIMGARSNPNTAAYCAAKAGVISLTQSAAMALAEHRVRVNAIGPGYMATAMTEGIRADADLSASVLDSVALGRFGTPTDIGDAAVFLASDEASYITGQVIYVDGGWLLHPNHTTAAQQRAGT